MAQSICETAIEIAERQNAKGIKILAIKIGNFARITKEQFIKSMELIIDDYPQLMGVELNVAYEPGKVKCNNCRNTSSDVSILNDDTHNSPPIIVQCEECESMDVEILSGTESYLDNITLSN